MSIPGTDPSRIGPIDVFSPGSGLNPAGFPSRVPGIPVTVFLRGGRYRGRPKLPATNPAVPRTFRTIRVPTGRTDFSSRESGETAVHVSRMNRIAVPYFPPGETGLALLIGWEENKNNPRREKIPAGPGRRNRSWGSNGLFVRRFRSRGGFLGEFVDVVPGKIADRENAHNHFFFRHHNMADVMLLHHQKRRGH